MANNNSTFVPGMQQNPGIPNPYASSANENVQGTFVPNMQAASSNPRSMSESSAASSPVVGFLYSISNGGVTEYWPIHLGANIIGRGPNVDICLKEATVSSRHAQINVKQLRVSHKLIANIQDIGSKCGMFLNEDELDYDPHSCKNGDIVTIGEAYKLYIVLIDTDACGLAAAPNFKAVEEKSETEIQDIPDFNHPSSMFNPYDRNDGTVDLSGAVTIGAPGGTMIME